MTNNAQPLPVLYSFRRCPYAIRARMALAQAGLAVELREVLLKDKPAAMLELSPKATVPVLQPANEQVIDESKHIMQWALNQHDPQGWLDADPEITRQLVHENDNGFKAALDRYKYHTRHPEQSREHYRARGEQFLQALENRLGENDGAGLTRASTALADIAIFPFIRQFAGADAGWFGSAPYPRLRQWLDGLVNGELFLRVMHKYKPWQPEQAPLIERWHRGKAQAAP